ncbi:MAG: hypothetical protein JWQ19_1244 [Subtercola sp.]|nr:hypothetical protein [Subtercola sp.]
MKTTTSAPEPRRSDNNSAEGTLYDRLRAQIIGGIITPGTQLVEGVLATEYGVSRSPVREALSKLTYDGLLERHGRAMRVRVLKAEDVLELYEVRIALERAAARAAAERRSELDLGRMTMLLQEMLNLPEGESERRPKLAHAFHFEIWRASHNATLEATLEAVHLQVLGLSSTTLHHEERWKVFVEESSEILDAVRLRDSVRAGDSAEKQMISARDFRVQLYSMSPDSLPDRHPLGM